MKKVFNAAAAALLTVGALAACNGPAKQAAVADTIYVNGKIYTVDESKPMAQAMAIRDGKFVAVGSVEEVNALKGNATNVVDLGGKVVLPSFVDEHIHLDMQSENYMNINFNPTDDYETFKKAINTFLAENPDSKWVFGGAIDWLQENGGNIVAFGKPSHKSILDEIVSDRPAFFWDIGGHAVLVNTKLLEQYNITKDTVPPLGGAYDKDENGELTGVLRESAAIEMWEAFNANRPNINDIAYKGVKPIVEQLNSYGITALTDAGTREFYVRAYNLLDNNDDLNMRVFAMITDEFDWKTQEMKDFANEGLANPDNYKTKRVNMGGVKLVLDGSAGGQTLVLTEPYEGTDYLGPWRLPPDVFAEKFKYYDDLGYTIKTHAVGDGAIRTVLDVAEESRKRGSKGRHSVAHSAFVNPVDRPRFKELDVIAELSPYFWFYNPAVEIVRHELGEERLSWGWPIKYFVENGTRYSFGSDWPVTHPDPWPAIESMITRAAPGDPEGRNWGPEWAVTLEQAIYGYTMGGAYGQSLENEIGSIEKGKFADFIILDQDIFSIPVGELHKTKVLETHMEGEVVYKR